MIEPKKMFMRLDITNHCNLKCPICYCSIPGFKARGRDMTPFEFKQICEKLSGNIRRLGLSCTFEPLTHPNFEEFLPYLKILGKCQSVINTNGILLSKKRSEAIVNSQLTNLCVSLDGACDESNYKVRGNHGFNKIIENIITIQKLKKELGVNKPELQISFTATLDNIKDLSSVIKIAHELRVNVVSVRHVMPIKGCLTKDKSCLLEPDITNKLFIESKKLAEKFSIIFRHPPAYPKKKEDLNITCVEPDQGFYIYSDGSCYSCTYLLDCPSIGNIYTDSIAEIMSAPFTEDLRNRLKTKKPIRQCMECLCDLQTIGEKYERDFIHRFK